MGRSARRAQFGASLKIQLHVATAPLNLDAVAANGQVALTWSAPSDTGGSSITDYQVGVSPATGVTGGVTRLVGSATTGYTFTGLTNGTGYTFTLRAVTAAGLGASASTAAIVPNTGGSLSTPNFTSIDVTNFQAVHSFATVSGATLYRIEIQKVG